MKTNLIFFLLFSAFALQSQNHDYFWVMQNSDAFPEEFSQANILDFSGNDLSISEGELNINTYSSLASISDQEGNLIFYSNNIQVMNSDFQFMENGADIVTGVYAENFYELGYPGFDNIIVLPISNQDRFYYVIYRKKETVYLYPQLLYSLVDMQADNGKGAVIAKEQLIGETVGFDSPTATRHANGRDWWVLVPHWHEAKIFRFLLTPQGIKDTITIDAGYEKPPYPDFQDISGQNVFSPDGAKYVDYDAFNGFRIFDFDRCSGSLLNPVIFTLPEPLPYSLGCQVSPNNRFLYMCEQDTVFQYDLQETNIAASKTIVAIRDGFIDVNGEGCPFLSMQTMPDGKIYIISWGDLSMSYISQPDLKGLACTVVQHGVPLPNAYYISKPHYPNYRLGPLDGSPCDTLGLNNIPVAKYRYDQDTLDALKVYFTDLSYYEPATWAWDFGDNSMSTDTSPVHTFAAAGTYEVCLTVANNNLPQGHIFCQTLHLGTSATGELPAFHNKLFPNPFRESTTLFIYDYLPADAYLVLYDAIGREVYRQQVFSGSNVAKPVGLVDGLYLYTIVERGEVVASGKVVKEGGE